MNIAIFALATAGIEPWLPGQQASALSITPVHLSKQTIVETTDFSQIDPIQARVNCRSAGHEDCSLQ